MNPSRKFGEMLVDRHLLQKDDLEVLLIEEEDTGVPFAQLVVERSLVREEDLLRVFAARVGLEFVDLDEVIFAPDVVVRLDAETCRRLNVVPIEMVGNSLKVAFSDPFDSELLREVERSAGCPIRPALAPGDMITAAIDGIFGREQVMVQGEDGELEEVEAPPQIHVNQLLLFLLEHKGSDLHLTTGKHPTIRIFGELTELTQFDELTPAGLREMLYMILTEKQRERLEEDLELDFSHPVPGHARFRVNVFFQRDSIGAVFRAIPEQVMSLDELGLPAVVETLAGYPRGLILVTGPTGSGKSTTLASVVDIINSTRACHILTIEDPIEFVHTHKKALVNQREVGGDTHGFGPALKHALRQDPDVILVGEMRDLETIQTALTAAETGHLVFATLHTQDAPQSIDRVVDVFPSHQQAQVRVQLAATLQAVITQQLLPRADGAGRAVATEVMIATPAVRNLIREAKAHQIHTAMQAGGKFGMQTMDQSLSLLVKHGQISYDMAVERCSNIEDLKRLLGRVA